MNRDAASETGSKGSTQCHRVTLLPEGFAPGDNDVICGRGKKCYSHIGNERFRQKVSAVLSAYSQAKSKLDKSNVLSSVVDQVRNASRDGGFVKQTEDGRWADVGDFLAREKTSQAFRDALHEQYKSSTVAKKKRRQREHARVSVKLSGTRSDVGVKRLDILSSKARSGSDEHINDLFSRSNAEIMNRINLLSRGALREDMSSPSQMGYVQTGLSGINSSANFNPFQFGTGQGQGPRRGVASYYSFPPCARNRPASGSQSPYQDIGEIDNLHHSLPNISYSHEMLPIDEELGPLNHSLPNLNHSVPDLHYTHQEANLNHSVPNLNYTHEEDTKLNHSVPNLNCTHEDAPFQTASTDIEPLPYDQYSPQNRKGSMNKEAFSLRAAAAATTASTKTQSRSAETESDDLLTCLVKLTETTIGDDNPFEPIPLANSSEHMISVDHSRYDDEDMTPEFGEDQSESLGRGEPRGIDV